MVTVALVGPDGAGKSTVAKRVVASLPFPAYYIYMGVNLESSSTMLPTTRLALAVKRARGGSAEMTPGAAEPTHRRRGPIRSLRSGLRMANWLAEEWFRQGIATIHERRGKVVVFDRHFFCDYYAFDVVDRGPGRSLASRVHGYNLRRLYPKPDLVVMLDAPAEVFFARKGEGTVESLELRRQEYLAQADLFRGFVIVDARQPADAVVAEVRERIAEFVRGAPPVHAAAALPEDRA
jgi:thymidylate kinase